MQGLRISKGGDGKTIARTFTLVGSILAALAGGTNYVFSAYAPQLGSRLHIDHTQLNMIGLAGNVGVYSSGPIWGAIADSRGPRPLYLLAMGGLLAGYFGIRAFYDGVLNLPADDTHSSTSFAFLSLIAFAYLSGAGGNAGLTASINATARSFSDSRRSTAVGLVAAGFGLSAFFFSTIAHAAFSDDTSAFLLVLALGTTIPNLLAFFIVRIIHHDEREVGKDERGGYSPIEEDEEDYSPLERRLDELDEERHHTTPAFDETPHSAASASSKAQRAHALDRRRSRPRTHSTDRHRSRSPASSLDLPSEFVAPPLNEHAHMTMSHDLEDIIESRPLSPAWQSDRAPNAELPVVVEPQTIPELLKTGDFWVIFAVVSLLAGTGLMWINNVGSIAQALVAQGAPDTWDQKRAAKVQAAQVSIVSVSNCLGRIIIGIATDYGKHKHNIRRCTWLIPISLLMFISQAVAARTTDPSILWRSSAMLGTAYGAMFSMAPMVVIEWFGLARFSRNWGTVALSPVLGGNLFSLAFGINLDSHASNPAPAEDVVTAVASVTASIARRAGLPDTSDHLCFDGLECYVSSLRMTMLACVGAALMSIFATWRDRKVYAVRDRLTAAAASAAASGAATPSSASALQPVRNEEQRLLSSS